MVGLLVHGFTIVHEPLGRPAIADLGERVA
jgi:hypothetical protein